jgi:hypothetical protein
MRKVTIAEMINLPPKKANFVIEYMKDFSPRRAAEASGFCGDSGYAMVQTQEISDAIEIILQRRLEATQIDTDWLLQEMVDNHMIARQHGNISASNTALALVGKHKRVDAFASDKIKVSTDADVMDKLVAARRRVSERQRQVDDEVSFL